MTLVFINTTATTENYTLSLHDALPIVIIIIGILAAIAIPVFLNQRKKGWDSQAKIGGPNVGTAVAAFLRIQTTYANNVDSLTPTTVVFKHTGGLTFTDMAAYDATGAQL